MLACALGDSYGAGFEFAPSARVREHNDLTTYIQHQKWAELKPGHYTDDTQMALAIAEHMLTNDVWSVPALATRFVVGFHRDPRAGYAGHFYDFLKKTDTGGAFVDNIRPHSDKSGGAMRAFPLGFLSATREVRDLAMFQASLTHATHDGMMAAAAAALMFHHRYHRIGDKFALPDFLSDMTGCRFTGKWKGKVSSSGLDCVKAALAALIDNDSMGDVLKACVAFTGDVDTVAAIAMPSAAVCNDTADWFPQWLVDRLENGTYGREFIRSMDEKLLAKYPTRFKTKEELDAKRQEKQQAKAAARANPAPKPTPEPEEPGLLDWLFDDNED